VQRYGKFGKWPNNLLLFCFVDNYGKQNGEQ